MACCSVRDDIAHALGGSLAEAAVCALRLVYQPAEAEGAAGAAGNSSHGDAALGPAPAVADLEALRELPWLVML